MMLLGLGIYTTNISDWEKIGQAYLEFFKEIRPVCTLIEWFTRKRR
jgi:hypothetical protein